MAGASCEGAYGKAHMGRRIWEGAYGKAHMGGASMTEPLELLLGVTDAARLAECAAETIRDNERRGRIKALKTVRGVRVFTRSEVERFKAARAARVERRQRRGDDAA